MSVMKINMLSKSADSHEYCYETGLLVVVFLLSTAFSFLITKVSLASLAQYSPIIALILTIGAGFFIRASILSISSALVLIIGSIFLQKSALDIYYDGITYHQDAMLNLIKGEFSLINNYIPGKYSHLTSYYPKLSWFYGAGITELTGDIVYSKSLNTLIIAATFLIGLSVIPFSLVARMIFSIALALNPIAVSQVYSNYVDGALGGFLIISIFGLYKLISSDFNKGLPLVLVGIAGASTLKFTGFVFSGVIFLSFIIWCLFQVFLEKNTASLVYSYKNMAGRTLGLCLMVSLFALILVVNPYLNNIIDGRHIFHPALGAEKIDDLISGQTRIEFYSLDRWTRLVLSVFSESSDHGPWAPTALPPAKIPFAIYPGEIDAFKAIDVRAAGWGPLFSGVLLIGMVFALGGKGKRDLCWVTLTLLAISIVNPESWWARFNPQLHTFALFLLILMFDNGRRIISSALAMLLILNSMLIYNSMSRYADGVKDQVIGSIIELSKRSPTGVLVWDMKKFHLESFFSRAGIEWTSSEESNKSDLVCSAVYEEFICYHSAGKI
ncbi:hypothetical protein [Pseudomonas sp. W03]|uniref:hypothetical protein n=1 Tax=Pseudomonas sp. W03 TaxID=3090666 RepID=UPI003A4DBD4D